MGASLASELAQDLELTESLIVTLENFSDLCFGDDLNSVVKVRALVSGENDKSGRAPAQLIDRLVCTYWSVKKALTAKYFLMPVLKSLLIVEIEIDFLLG